MPENPIAEIENAELGAKRTVQKANEDKASIISAAREKATRELSEAVQKAQAESENIIQAAGQSSQSDIAALNSAFEEEKRGMTGKAKQGESAAIDAVMEIIGAKIT